MRPRRATTRTRAGLLPDGSTVTGYPVNCRPGCGHTPEEHTAFDDGHAAATAGQPDFCPHATGKLRAAWQAGWTTANLNRQHAAK